MSAVPGEGLSQPWFGHSSRPKRNASDHTGPGSRALYQDGCRCVECKAAHAAYGRESYARKQQKNAEIRGILARMKEKR